MSSSIQLFLFPVALLTRSAGDEVRRDDFSANYLSVLSSIRLFFVENAKSSRAFIRKLLPEFSFDGVEFIEYQSKEADCFTVLKKALESGTSAGLMSDRGMPCVGDPGAKIVDLAHRLNIQVRPLPGPSSIFLALMSCGFESQKFRFHWYLPIEEGELRAKIRELELESAKDSVIQLFIETPYRNARLIKNLLGLLADGTQICMATLLSAPNELIVRKSVHEWRKDVSGGRFDPESMNRKETVYLVYAR